MLNRMHVVNAFMILIVATSGCDAILGKQVKSSYCATNPDDPDCPQRDAGDHRCMTNSQCTDPAATVCDIAGSMTCVQCLLPDQTSACTSAALVCVNDQCQKCTAHAQCVDSDVCLPTGTCADKTAVAYVAEGGTGTSAAGCTKDSPCGTLNVGLKAGKTYVKIAAQPGVVTDDKATTIDGQAATILADPGAAISRTMPGVILQVQNDGADVKIFDLEITLGTGINNPAISIPNGGAPKLALTRVTVDGNQGVGISSSAGVLTISQSTISGNTGGGLSISGAQFDVTNSFIVQNGGAMAVFGGVKIDAIGANAVGPNRLDFNTITANLGPANANLGIECGTVLTPLTFSDNIVYANIVSGGGQQVAGANCSTTYSDVGPSSVPSLTDIDADPQFVSLVPPNYHLKVSSPAKDTADPNCSVSIDFDGDTRPQGPRCDMGADEIKQ